LTLCKKTAKIQSNLKTTVSTTVIKHETPTIPLEIDISGAKELRLYCTDADDGINSDHATWANARVDTESLMAVTTQGKIITTWASIRNL